MKTQLTLASLMLLGLVSSVSADDDLAKGKVVFMGAGAYFTASSVTLFLAAHR